MFILHYFNFSHSRETIISGGQQSKRESIAGIKIARSQQRRSFGFGAEVHRVESVKYWGELDCDVHHDKGQLTSFSANWQHHGHVWWTDTPPNFQAGWRLKFYKIYKHKLQTSIQVFSKSPSFSLHVIYVFNFKWRACQTRGSFCWITAAFTSTIQVIWQWWTSCLGTPPASHHQQETFILNLHIF